MKILVDIDGTLARFKDWAKFVLKWEVERPNNKFFLFLGYIVYIVFYGIPRKKNEKLIEKLRKMARNGETIYIFSAVPDGIARRRIEDWLRKNRIPFKGLFLLMKNESPLEFKMRVIEEVKPELIFENNQRLIREIEKKFPKIKVLLP